MKCLLIGERYRKKLENSLNLHGFKVFWLPDNPDLDPRLASHADLSVFLYGKNVILSKHLAISYSLVNFLTNSGFNIIQCKSTQDAAYPADINLCAAVVGDKLIHNTKYTDQEIINNFIFQRIHIAQGYARCTILTVGQNGLITADRAIANAAARIGIDVLEISTGDIELEGFDTGFIGGASFTVEDTIYFTGDIQRHPDAQEIASFISDHGIKICCLTEDRLFDIGGAVFIDTL